MNVSDFPIVSLITFLPLAGALVVAFLPGNRPNLARYTALGFALAAWVASLILLVGFTPGRPGFEYIDQQAWVPLFGIQYKVGVDGLSMAMVVLTTTLTWISILASFRPIQNRVKEYMVSFLVLEVGMTGVFVSLDLFLFYVFWELVLVPMYLIIGIWGGANRIYATIKFVLYTLTGSLLMLVAILATAFTYQAATGSWAGAFDLTVLRGFPFDSTFQMLAFGAFFLAFAIKVPMFPFHTWLPDAHVEAPTAGSVILAGVLLKLGGYGFIRFALPLYPDAAQTWAPAIIVLSLIAIIYGAIVALVQPDLKKLVAYSSVSHMGFVTLGIFVFQQQALQGAILQMVNHGLITGRPVPAGGRDLRADARPHDRQDGRPGCAGSRLCGRVRVLRVRVGRAAGPIGLRRGVPDAGRHVRGLSVGGGRGHARDDLRRRVPAVDVPASGVRRAVGLPQGTWWPPDRPASGGSAHPGPAGRAGRGVRPVPRPDPGPRLRVRHLDAQRGAPGRADRPRAVAVGGRS